MKKISIGTWAYVTGPYEKDPVDFNTVLAKLKEYGLDGLELGGFAPHPNPDEYATPESRQKLRQQIADHGLGISGLAANLWMHKLPSVPDSGPFVAEFAKNLFFAEDLGIDMIRVDTVEPIDQFAKSGVDPKVAFGRVVNAFDLCCKLAAQRGVKVTWEFEPGFVFNKPSEIVALVEAVRGKGNDNFGVMYDTCHAHMCASVGANQLGDKETLPGGAGELLAKLKGMITHIHLIDSDGTLNEHNTSTHAPFGQGSLNFDELLPALEKADIPTDWWCVDLCFWPDAWNHTEQSQKFLAEKRQQYTAA